MEGDQKIKVIEEDNERTKTELKEVVQNEEECRRQIQNMAHEIDEREDKIEMLEDELDWQRRKNREMFKQQIRQPIHASDALDQLQVLSAENSQLKELCSDLQ